MGVLVTGCSPQEVCTWEQTHLLGALMVLHNLCVFLVTGASAKADECRLVELQLEVALRCVVLHGIYVGIFCG